ncbi:secretagogin-like isoform 1-T1 [Pholidichthys leucotaenia]
MESGFDNLDAAGFLEIWQHFDADDNGYIEGKELDDFFRHMKKKLCPKSEQCKSFNNNEPWLEEAVLGEEKNVKAAVSMVTWLKISEQVTDDGVRKLKQRFMSAYDVTADGRLEILELANMILPEDENFLLVFRREAPLDNSVTFMKIWRKYDVDCSGYISAQELSAFLKDLFDQDQKEVTADKLEQYTDAMMKIFDKNKDGRLDLNDMARILALQENFLLQFEMDASSKEERKRDFDKIFNHYDVSKTGALEGPEVDGFVKDMMELVRPSLTGPDLDELRRVVLCHCDFNKDGKIQKNELALCLGVKPEV